MTWRIGTLVLTLCSVLGACVHMAPERVRVRWGPARGQPLGRVVALPATGGASFASPVGREPLVLSGVDAIIRAALDFEGYRVVDAERLNVTTWSHTERQVTTGQGSAATEATTRDTERTGAAFEDAPPAVQRAILAELGAEGVVNARIWIGPHMGAGSATSASQTVTVQVRLIQLATGGLVWARRCEIEVAGFVQTSYALEQAARCAVEAGSL